MRCYMATNVERWQKEAKDHEIQFIEYRNGPTNVYLLPCGHEQRLSPNSVVDNSFECSICAARNNNLEI